MHTHRHIVRPENFQQSIRKSHVSVKPVLLQVGPLVQMRMYRCAPSIPANRSVRCLARFGGRLMSWRLRTSASCLGTHTCLCDVLGSPLRSVDQKHQFTFRRYFRTGDVELLQNSILDCSIISLQKVQSVTFPSIPDASGWI